MTADLATLPTIAPLLLGLAACVTDARTRRVPNALTGVGALVALLVHTSVGGVTGLAWSMAGGLLGLAILLPLFALRGLGGGDVKLLAAFGAWTGPRLVAWTGLYGAIAGGVLALVVVLWHGVLRQTVSNLGVMTTSWRVAGLGPVDGLTLDSSRSPKLPYAIPLTCGLVVALWLKA